MLQVGGTGIEEEEEEEEEDNTQLVTTLCKSLSHKN
jgi:hypothetical protein